MDDVITGSDDVETALEMRFQLDKMMSRGGFKLRKWASNCSKVLDDIPPEDLAIKDSEKVTLDPTASVKTLGLTWLPKPDVLRFQFNIPELEEDTKLSKRQILIQQFMGELPASRVTVSRPFSRAGVDYFGPVYLRPAPRRPAVKAYVAPFICLCTKAVHLELVSDLSTDRFLQAQRRFVARRGKCTDIFSDNGINFVGARNKLREFLMLLKDKTHREAVSTACSTEGIQWHFSPPSAPHFGGLWEAAVRSAKKHLLKAIGENPVSPEDFTTLLVQVEGCLNSRPLTSMSEDPNDLEPLTPSHFLVGASLQAFPEPNLENVQLNRLNKWQLMQRKLQDFWRRWRREYLYQLQARTKRWKPPVQIEVGKLVVIQDDNLPPMRWRMGRIHKLHPGDDQVVRVVTVKTAGGMLTRPVEKLCILPLPDSDDDVEAEDNPSNSLV
ncbi:uncharacterized protein LOC131680486 [Topomyia yanbarensis]|uniref:uncharacterized protein LOC131680486 n=1 Tax=Topomyia yanbarensis TaxID=2498891 RepID=UPI00273A9397|nr:uncharacterized protein LOC131680486 [Topomyia yanbarensis]